VEVEVVAGAGAGTEAVRGARGLKEVMQIGCSDPSLVMDGRMLAVAAHLIRGRHEPAVINATPIGRTRDAPAQCCITGTKLLPRRRPRLTLKQTLAIDLSNAI
jgi:hypothetical protein